MPRLASWLNAVAEAMHARRLDRVAEDVAWWLAVAIAVARAGLGRLVAARPLNRILGYGFRAFNVGFNHSANAYTPASSAGPCV